jgi:glycosyltransferase involved in cell wall biosynthesis
MLHDIVEHFGGAEARGRRYGFVGNLANNMALRALPLRRQGYDIKLFLHPHDRSILSHPGWELSDAVLNVSETDMDRLQEQGLSLPEVPDTYTYPTVQDPILLRSARTTPANKWEATASEGFLRQLDVLLWPSYFAYLPLLRALRTCDALFAAQAPYLAYLANRPYLATQTGGDLWLDCSRNDAHGILQRLSYAQAQAILATNPWAYSNARRFGFRHVLYVPLLIDTEAYTPAQSPAREEWRQQVGGEFFALVTARIDRHWKGSHIGIDGFARFLAIRPEARLVLVGWGESQTEEINELRRVGLDGRFVLLPVSGKRKLVEYLRAADCLIDQFVIGYYGATALEAMACGLPVIMRLARDQYDALCPTGAPPVLDADNANDVAAALDRLAASPEESRRISAASREWVMRNHSVDVWGERYGALLNAVAGNARFLFHDSPLMAPLSRYEIEYHAAGLRAAPPFPNYTI